MNKTEFLTYVSENFNISGEAYRLISNILNYIEMQGLSEDDQYLALCDLLNGTIGLSDAEIKRIVL